MVACTDDPSLAASFYKLLDHKLGSCLECFHLEYVAVRGKLGDVVSNDID